MKKSPIHSGFFHDDAFFRASIGAQSASYAFLLIDLPLLVRPADRDRLLRTFAGAQPAEHAVVRCLRQLALLFVAGICFGVLFGVWGRIALFHVQTFLGQTFTQLPHCTQSKRSMDQVPAARSTVMARGGQFCARKVQLMHSIGIDADIASASAAGRSHGSLRVMRRDRRRGHISQHFACEGKQFDLSHVLTSLYS